MLLSLLANVGTIVEAVVVIVSVIFVWYEIRENTRLTRVANSQKLTELAAPFNLQLIQDREMAKLWVSGSAEYPTMDPIDQYRYQALLIWWLLLHENIFYQKEQKLLDDESYAPWKHDLEDFVGRQRLEQLWGRIEPNLQTEFARYVKGLIDNEADNALEPQTTKLLT